MSIDTDVFASAVAPEVLCEKCKSSDIPIQVSSVPSTKPIKMDLILHKKGLHGGRARHILSRIDIIEDGYTICSLDNTTCFELKNNRKKEYDISHMASGGNSVVFDLEKDGKRYILKLNNDNENDEYIEKYNSDCKLLPKNMPKIYQYGDILIGAKKKYAKDDLFPYTSEKRWEQVKAQFKLPVVSYGLENKNYMVYQYVITDAYTTDFTKLDTLKKKFTFCISLCEALQVLYSNGLIHNDLKCANVGFKINKDECECIFIDHDLNTFYNLEKNTTQESWSSPYCIDIRSTYFPRYLIKYKSTQTAVCVYDKEIVKQFYAIGFAGILLEVFGKNSVGNSEFMSQFGWDRDKWLEDSYDLRPSIVELCSDTDAQIKPNIIEIINQLMGSRHSMILVPVNYARKFRYFMDEFEKFPIETQKMKNYISI
jgi:serine/threonine protein kinase